MAIGGMGLEAAHRNAVITCGVMGASSLLHAAVDALFALSIALQALYFPRLDGWREWAAEPAPGC